MKDRLLIGEVCRRLDCTPRTVRYYEEKGLVVPVDVTSGGRKLYGKETVSIIRTAQVLKRPGYSLEDIHRIMALTRSSDTGNRRLTENLRKILRKAVSSLDGELELLTSSRRKMADLLEKTEKCEKCSSEDCSSCGSLTKLRTLGLLES